MTVRATPTIAVVAVPGPEVHRPGDAARAVADVLLRVRDEQGNRYSAFVERSVRIPTKPARVNPRSAPNVAPDLGRAVFAEQHPFLRTQLKYGGAAARDREEDSPDHQLMRAQLAAYESAGEPYDTIRLDGERLGDAADGGTREVQAGIHVHEVRWTDLSRTGSAPRVVSELYQLLLHIAHLGRTALDHARLEHPASRLWRSYGVAHTWAVRLLTAFVPAAVAATLMVSAAVALLAISGWVRPGEAASLVDRVLLGTLVVAGGGLSLLVFRRYERLRPGALVVGLAAYLLAGAALAVVTARAAERDALLDGTLRVLEAVAVAGALVWDGIFLLGAIAGALGLVACLRAGGASRERARRAVRTAAATLAVVVSLAAAGTLLLWSMIFRTLAAMLPERPYVAMVPGFRSDEQTFAGFFEQVLEVTAGAGMPLLLAAAGVLTAAGALMLVPAVILDVRPPRSADAPDPGAPVPPPRNAPIDTDVLWSAWERFRREGDASQRLGQRLTRGLGMVSALVVLLYAVVFVVAPGLSVAHWLTAAPALAPLQATVTTIGALLGGVLIACTVVLVVARGGAGRGALGFRPLVDVLLAVDDYLRTHPVEATPRARIAERYVSLLRHLCQWRDGNGRPYDAIVLAAHSHGAAITADLLTFVQREEDPELEPIRRPLANGVPGAGGRRLFLLTTGAPLRQVYSAWFPHLFGWVRGATGDGVSRPLPAVPREPWTLLPRLEEGHRVHAPAIRDDAAPDPYAIGLTRWVNVYRSGDYVGRALWRASVDGCDWMYRPAPVDAATRFVGDAPPVTYVSEDAHRSRRELCIGAGAHSRYWDGSAPAIGVELDLIVVDAVRLAVRVGKDTGAPAEG